MSVKKMVQGCSPAALAVLVASCSSSVNVTDSEPETGNASNENVTVLDGRVADGYIQGATVCVDVNSNDACDSDEPFAVTIEGGAYSLSVPDGIQNKSIVAAIPETAIDEDTGEAIGEAIVFIAPPADSGSLSGFVSPLTTMIHQELQSNPSLDIEDAEEAVKSLLGVEDSAISLFDNYVEEKTQSGGASEQYELLHNTARVLTSIMIEIETEVENAATTDVAGADAQSAIREIARSEIRSLLPEIATEVAQSADNNTVLDLSAIVDEVVPDDIASGVDSRIAAVQARVESVQSDIQAVLNDGVYWLELDCGYESYEQVPGTSNEGPDSVAQDEASEGCSPTFGTVQLDNTSGELVAQTYQFDSESGWVLESDDQAGDFVLANGQWQESSDGAPEGTVVFDDADGSATVSGVGSTMRLRAATQNVAALSVQNFLWNSDIEPNWYELLSDQDIYPAGSEAHIISVRETLSPYLLFNAPAPEDDADACAGYADNCNVILDSQSASAIETLDFVRNATVQGIELQSALPEFSAIGNMSFVLNAAASENMPVGGTVEWPALTANVEASQGGADSTMDDESGVCTTTDGGTDESDTTEGTDTTEGSNDPTLSDEDSEGDNTSSQECSTVEGRDNSTDGTSGSATSTWNIVVADGVTMIEVNLPEGYGYAPGESILLIEHQGYVRKGERTADLYIDKVVTFNASAFPTMQAISQRAVAEQ